MLQHRDMNRGTQDVWTFTWSSRCYNSRKIYTQLLGTVEASALFTWLQSSSNLGKHKLFFWLLLRDRLNTSNLLRRKNKELDDYSCVLCNSGLEETSFHLFFECPFSQTCQSSMNIHLEICSYNPLTWSLQLEKTLAIQSREVMMTACWTIWRNSVIFDNGVHSLNAWKIHFRQWHQVEQVLLPYGRRVTLSMFFFFFVEGEQVPLHTFLFSRLLI